MGIHVNNDNNNIINRFLKKNNIYSMELNIYIDYN